MPDPKMARGRTRKTVRLRLEVDCAGQVRTALLQSYVLDMLRRGGEARITGPKGTLPDPETPVSFSAFFGSARVLQGRGGG